MNKWYDDWKFEYDTSGNYKVDLPHSFGNEKSIQIKGKYTKKHVHFLFITLICALEELSNRDKKSGKLYFIGSTLAELRQLMNHVYPATYRYIIMPRKTREQLLGKERHLWAQLDGKWRKCSSYRAIPVFDEEVTNHKTK